MVDHGIPWSSDHHSHLGPQWPCFKPETDVIRIESLRLLIKTPVRYILDLVGSALVEFASLPLL